MSEQKFHHFLSKDLQQIALQLAAELHKVVFKKYNFDISVVPREKVPRVKQAYERAESWIGIMCPHCWIKNGQNSLLDVAARRDKEDLYHCKCKTCDFEYHFSHPKR